MKRKRSIGAEETPSDPGVCVLSLKALHAEEAHGELPVNGKRELQEWSGTVILDFALL